ncbi:AvrD family protein [Dactylosporangium sp. CA-092794]|uniref:AvrD family protein n=1 Tax=Dactylosporangium sp. CA-092794 TaxID=3239929 RepID=UPI003D94D5A8
MEQLTLRDGGPRGDAVDDYLGNGAHRFFGEGYKRARQRLAAIGVHVGADGTGTVEASASVSYPPDWSRKGSADQPPHLSSIDVLLVAGEVAEVYLTRALGLTPEQRAGLRLRRVRLQAGTTPVEQELAAFGVRARIGAPADGPHRDGLAISTVDCEVGTLRARAEVLHPAQPVTPGSAAFADADAALGPAALRPFAAAHRAKGQSVDRIELDASGHRARARLAATWSTPDGLALTGLESYAHRAVSIVDVFVAAIQLGQILLYELDGVRRADSNTLWMRRTTLDIAEPGRPVSGPGPIEARLDDAELLAAGDGTRWRAARIEAAFDHMSIGCAVAHRLPGGIDWRER